MAQIHFNRIYIIESLQHGDTLTGTNLHNDFLRYQSSNHPDFESILKNPKGKKEWNELFAEIKKDCEVNGNAPIKADTPEEYANAINNLSTTIEERKKYKQMFLENYIGQSIVTYIENL